MDGALSGRSRSVGRPRDRGEPVGGDLPGFRPQQDVLAGHPSVPPADRRAGTMVPYTSGTTGRPKAIWREPTVRILDDAGAELGPGEIGTVYIDGGRPGFRYLGDEEQTANAYRGSAFTIGDVGHLDEDDLWRASRAGSDPLK